MFHRVSSCFIVLHRASSCSIVLHRAPSCSIVLHPASSCFDVFHRASSCTHRASSCFHRASSCCRRASSCIVHRAFWGKHVFSDIALLLLKFVFHKDLGLEQPGIMLPQIPKALANNSLGHQMSDAAIATASPKARKPVFYAVQGDCGVRGCLRCCGLLESKLCRKVIAINCL